ncbi:MAG: protein kinase, partial [Deltaproteobacteria bacterium]|nr:protein kinase [Deltaproteobacteria bacterium]
MIEDAIADPLDAERVKQEVARRLFGAPIAPLRIGRFEVNERIGAGGMSVVYRAHDPELGRDVAIKLLKAGGRSERLRREARVLAKLRHPNVVTVYEVGTWREHAFVALEHVVGSTLDAWAQGRSHDEIAARVVEVARGLDTVHRLGVVHRDVKPANIVVDASGAARLIDFGLVTDDTPDADVPAATTPDAPTKPSAPTLTRDGAIPGTPRYMAPELQGGAPSTPRSDQHSLGVTLDELTRSGARAPAIERVIARATDRDPARRFEDLASFADALAPTKSPRGSLLPAMLALVAVIALGIGLAFVWSSRTPEPSALAPSGATHEDDPPWIVALVEGSDHAEAREAQRRGLFAYRTGDDGGALAGFEGALALDPTYGAAELGLAMVYAQGTVHEARPHLARAVAARSTL